MIPEIGQFALVLALCMALLQSLPPLLGGNGHSASARSWRALAIPAARGQALFVLIAFACLTAAFIDSDFSVAYVAQNSNTDLPFFYRVSAVWGGHEGSILLWARHGRHQLRIPALHTGHLEPFRPIAAGAGAGQ